MQIWERVFSAPLPDTLGGVPAAGSYRLGQLWVVPATSGPVTRGLRFG